MTALAGDWLDRGACIDLPTDWFFPSTDEPGNNHAVDAKRACASCAVRAECLTAAVERNEEHGIWGGAGEDQRRWLRRAWVADGHTAGERYRTELALFFDRLEHPRRAPVPDRNGPGATHFRRVTYARGSRDPWDCLAAVSEGRAPRGRDGGWDAVLGKGA